MFLQNCWYLAGWSSELGGKPLARTYLNQNIVLFRDGANKAQAITNRCPHRFVPLSEGQIVNGNIECPYHGLQFDGAGKCQHSPQGDIPTNAIVKSYPLIEKWNMLWIWMGDIEKADDALIPDFSLNGSEENYFAGGYLKLNCNYLLATDNILDLSHIDFIHKNSIGVKFGKPKKELPVIKRNGNEIWSNREYYEHTIAESTANDFGITDYEDKLFDRWFEVRWSAPSLMILFSGFVDAGKRNLNQPYMSIAHSHIFTPETETTSHYWFAASHPKSKGESFAQAVDIEVSFLAGPFETEDGPMLALQQKAMGDKDFWENKPVLLVGDAGAIQARRIVDKLLADEAV